MDCFGWKTLTEGDAEGMQTDVRLLRTRRNPQTNSDSHLASRKDKISFLSIKRPTRFLRKFGLQCLSIFMRCKHVFPYSNVIADVN